MATPVVQFTQTALGSPLTLLSNTNISVLHVDGTVPSAGNPPALYTDITGQTVASSNVFTTDNYGNLSFFAPPAGKDGTGRYAIQFPASGHNVVIPVGATPLPHAALHNPGGPDPVSALFLPETYGALGYATLSAAVASGHDNGPAFTACFAAAAAVNGTVLLDSLFYPCATQPTITGSVTVAGKGCVEVGFDGFGPNTAPFLAGSVILITGAGLHGLAITGSGIVVNLDSFGVLFAPAIQFVNTGHGIFSQGPVSGNGHDFGIQNSSWRNVKVFGHDGNHYARYLVNPLLCTSIGFRSYGGGVSYIAADSSTSPHVIIPGNWVDMHTYGSLFANGSAHGFVNASLTSSGAGNLNLMVFIRPQCNAFTYATNAAMGNPTKPSTTQYLWHDRTAAGYPSHVSVYDPDWESDAGQTQPFNVGPGTVIYGFPNIGSGSAQANYRQQPPYEGMQAGTVVNCLSIGPNSMRSNAANGNTGIGANALSQVTTGANNTGIGACAGDSLGDGTLAVKTGSNNMYLGSFSGPSNTNDLSNNTAVGYQARVAQGGDVAVGAASSVGGWNAVAVGTSASVGVGASGAIAIGQGVQANASGAVAIGQDHTGAAASTAVQDEIKLGTAAHTVSLAALKFNAAANESTGSGSAALGANCPAVTPGAPYKWEKVTTSDGSTGYMPVWK